MQLAPLLEDTRKRWEAAPAARFDGAAWRAATWRQRAGRDERAGRRAAGARCRPALRRRTLDGLRGRGLVAVADDAAGDRSDLRNILEAGGALAGARRRRPDADQSRNRASPPARRSRCASSCATPRSSRSGTPSIAVRVTAPDGRTETLPATPEAGSETVGRYVAQLRPAIAGVFRVSADVRRGASAGLGSATALGPRRRGGPRDDRSPAERAAAATACGSDWRPTARRDRLADLGDLLEASVPAAAFVTRRDLWHTGWSFAAILVLLGPSGSCDGGGVLR